MRITYNKPAKNDLSLSFTDNDSLEKMLETTVRKIAIPRPGASKNHKTVQKYIKKYMNGYVDEHDNVIAGDPTKAKIIVGSHYDSVAFTPGADDNASAVAVMLAAFYYVGTQDDKICYVAFDGEETGFTGSSHFVLNLITNGHPNLEQVHILEMIGFTSDKQNNNPLERFKIDMPDKGDFLGLASNGQSGFIVNKVLENFGDNDALPLIGVETPVLSVGQLYGIFPDILLSDHCSFWRAGIPAVMWTDTAFHRNPNYHKRTDTPDTLDYKFMTRACNLLMQILTKD